MSVRPTVATRSPTPRRAVLGALALSGVAGVGYTLARRTTGGADAASTGPVDGGWTPPPASADWQWQLSGTVNTGYDVALYDVDGFETPRSVLDSLAADGRYLVAYFSGGSYERWRPDADDFPESVLGTGLDGWPGERWLDVTRHDVLEPIMRERARLARAKGFDAIEWDNVDVYANPNTGVSVSATDQLAYNRLLARIAHDHGLAAILKNDAGQAAALEPAFDGCLAEQAYEYDEVDAYAPFLDAGKWLGVCEYQGPLDCADARERGLHLIRKQPRLGPGRPVSCG
ncbi:endo alpha-1,4 polygalactosaminidase [Halococcus salsus]|uniref:endo alpha-1,4 polygalactosaminidase n=1 Tax=Halococcus salsus TaxID=2162894 RepID=UPI00135BC783|nr:endo alpha-1,4 polygalactosaminidase [Halococcus salsus]